MKPRAARRILACQGMLLIAHIAQTLAQRLEVIEPGVIDFGMVTAQDDLMLVVAENAALEFTGDGHGESPDRGAVTIVTLDDASFYWPFCNSQRIVRDQMARESVARPEPKLHGAHQ